MKIIQCPFCSAEIYESTFIGHPEIMCDKCSYYKLISNYTVESINIENFRVLSQFCFDITTISSKCGLDFSFKFPAFDLKDRQQLNYHINKVKKLLLFK